MPKYSIRKNRIKRGCVTGLKCTEDSRLIMEQDSMYHSVFLKGIDGGETGRGWGRLYFDVKCSENVVYCIYVAAADYRDDMRAAGIEDLDSYLTDASVETPEKTSMLKRFGAKRFMGVNDCLIYDLKGRFLYLAIEVIGEGELEISRLVVDSEGDNFMATYPEIYRERNSFFHRYISIFSSIYKDFGEDIEALPRILDIDTCPEELLTIYGSWMGIDLNGGFLDVKVLRALVKEAYSLNKMKGTKRAIERILEIILGERAMVIEHNQVRGWTGQENTEVPKSFKAKGIYDVTILVNKHLTEDLRHQILFVLEQFKPVRTRINITQLDETPITDSNTYLDVNTRLPEESGAVLDEEFTLDGTIVLS
ncbi:MAG: phage tail protein [Lachnospiraceae bacterium]|nr:phage tail protein [Lachnospiraceae bacterium]